MKLAGIAVIGMLLTSCVGIGVVGGEREEHGGFSINETRSKPMRRVMSSKGPQNPTRGEVRSSWGEPDRKSVEEGREIWSYHSGLSIRGAIPMLGFGLPLVAPVGKNSFDFHFPNSSDPAEKIVVEKNRFMGGYFGVSAFSESKGFGFHKLGE